jgi:hypothetical protein
LEREPAARLEQSEGFRVSGFGVSGFGFRFRVQYWSVNLRPDLDKVKGT